MLLTGEVTAALSAPRKRNLMPLEQAPNTALAIPALVSEPIGNFRESEKFPFRLASVAHWARVSFGVRPAKPPDALVCSINANARRRRNRRGGPRRARLAMGSIADQ